MQKSMKNHLKIGELPDLRIVPFDRLRFHEEHDEARFSRLVKTIGAEGILKNPPIVGKVGSAQDLIILDGANRVTALDHIGIRHIPVQIVDFHEPRLLISCWHHAVERKGREHFLDQLRKLPGLEVVETEASGPDKPGNRAHLCSLSFREGTGCIIISPDGLQSQVEHLKRITGSYLNTSYADRVSYTNPEHLRRNYPDFQTLVTFREFSKEQVLELISKRYRLPAGITRIILPKRVLGLNTSLTFLNSALTLEEKNARLNETITGKIARRSIRFYQESTFVFDE